jgi:hypothetical protein
VINAVLLLRSTRSSSVGDGTIVVADEAAV